MSTVSDQWTNPSIWKPALHHLYDPLVVCQSGLSKEREQMWEISLEESAYRIVGTQNSKICMQASRLEILQELILQLSWVW
jgi:hypothetical protein